MLKVKSCPWPPGISGWLSIQPKPDSARDVGNEPATRLNEVIAHAKAQPEIVILDPFENRFGNAAEVKLIITAQPTITLDYAPADARRDEFCTDLIIAGGINDAEQVCGLERELKSVRVEFRCNRLGSWLCGSCERLRASEKKSASN